MQGDGNLVLYNPVNPGQPENPIWNTNTWGQDSNAKVVLQNDGNLVLLGFANPTKPLWTSNSAQPGFQAQPTG